MTKTTVLFKNDSAARYTPWDGGRLLFVKNDNLYSQRLNRSSRALEAQPELVVKGVASRPALMRADFSVAADGTIAWRPGHAALAQVTVFDRKGAVIGSAGPPGAFESVFVSPADDSRLLIIGTDVGVVDVGQSGLLALPRDTQWINWLDGGRVFGLQGGNRIVARPADNIGSTDQFGQVPTGFRRFKLLSPDGKLVVGQSRLLTGELGLAFQTRRLPPGRLWSELMSRMWISASHQMVASSFTRQIGAFTLSRFPVRDGAS